MRPNPNEFEMIAAYLKLNDETKNQINQCFRLGSVDNSDLDVPRLVRGIQIDPSLCNSVVH